MTTERQAEANRANAAHSTGPRTLDGKAASAQNARTHGLLSEQVVLAGEDAEAFKRLSDGLIARCRPDGELEIQLVERMASCLWRLRRVHYLEVGLFEYDMEASRLLDKFSSPEALTLRGSLARTFVRLGNGADAFSKLSRYEVAIERSFYQALHELQRVQDARTGHDVAPPVAIDVTVTPSEIDMGK